MDNYNNSQNNGSQGYENQSYNTYGNNTQYYENPTYNGNDDNRQYYENGSYNSNANDPWANNIQQTNYIPPQNADDKQKDNNKVVLYVAIGLGALAVIMAVALLIITFASPKSNKEGGDTPTEATTEDVDGTNSGKPTRDVSDYITNGKAYITPSGTYYEPNFRIGGSYVQSVISEINSDLNRLKVSADKYSDNAVFQYKAYLNGNVLSVVFESGYPGDMKSRYYNINVSTGARASLRELQIQAGMSEDEFGAKLLASQRKELNKIYSANGWGDINSNILYCHDCWNPYNSETHLKEVRYYLDGNCKIHIVNYYPGATSDVMVLKDIICEF